MSDITAAPAAPAPATPGAPAPTAAPVVTAPTPVDPAALVIGEPTPAPAAPVVPPAPAPAEAMVEYEPTGNVGLDLALKFVGERGLGAEHPAMVAARAGDFGILTATLAQMGTKAQGYEAMVALAKQAFEQTSATNAARAAKDLETVHKIVGGAENWSAIKTWAGATADADEKAAINAALAAGGVQATMAASYLAGLYSRATGIPKEGKPAVGDSRSAAAGTGALSPTEYTEAVKELARTSRVPLDSNPKYQELRSRRAAWRG